MAGITAKFRGRTREALHHHQRRSRECRARDTLVHNTRTHAMLMMGTLSDSIDQRSSTAEQHDIKTNKRAAELVHTLTHEN